MEATEARNAITKIELKTSDMVQMCNAVTTQYQHQNALFFLEPFHAFSCFLKSFENEMC